MLFLTDYKASTGDCSVKQNKCRASYPLNITVNTQHLCPMCIIPPILRMLAVGHILHLETPPPPTVITTCAAHYSTIPAYIINQ